MEKSSIEIWEQEQGRLNSLPNDIILNILSPFPLKFAIETAVLSWRWRYLWTQIDSLYIRIVDVYSIPNIRKVLNQVMLQSTSSTIRKLQISSDVLSYHICEKNSVCCQRAFCYRWLDETWARNVEEIEIILISQVTCQSLLGLPDYGTGISLSRLKKLTIRYVQLHQRESIDKLINSCLSLEDLSLGIFVNSDYRCKLRVCGKSLRRPFVQCEFSGNIVIDAPKLECIAGLDIDPFVTSLSVECNAIALLVADIKNSTYYFPNFDNRRFLISSLLDDLTSIRSLAMSSSRLGGSIKLPYLTHLKLDQVFLVKLSLETLTILKLLSCFGDSDIPSSTF